MSIGNQASRAHSGPRNVSKRLMGPILLSAVFLAGCGDNQSDGPMKPGIYAYEGPDGVKHRMVFSDNGTYSDMQDNVPKPVEQGEWLRRDGQLCLTSGKTGKELCLREKAEANGGFSLSGNGITTHFSLEAGGR